LSKQTKRAAKKRAPAKRVKRAAPKRKRTGRPTKYLPIFAEQARVLCERGATDAELADVLRVSISTVRNWQAEHPEFLAAVRLGKELPDERVKRSLYQRAVGYSFDTVTIFAPTTTRGPAIVEHREHCPPDVGAQKLWLTNRCRDEWKERHDHELGGRDGKPIETKDVSERPSDLEIARRVAFLLSRAAPIAEKP
jgi:hypothetical protein